MEKLQIHGVASKSRMHRSKNQVALHAIGRGASLQPTIIRGCEIRLRTRFMDKFQASGVSRLIGKNVNSGKPPRFRSLMHRNLEVYFRVLLPFSVVMILLSFLMVTKSTPK
jgi:hypothetical protein